MKIGFDLDRIFINYPPFIPSKLIDKRYKLKENGELIYRFPKKPEQWIRIALHFHPFRPLIKENVEVLKKLDHKHNSLYLISSRFGFLEKRTESVMKRYGLEQYFDAVYFNFTDKQPHLFKNELLKELKLDIYVDDDLSLLKFVAKDNKKTKLFWLNYSFSEQLNDNLFAIKSLTELFTT